VQVFPYKWVVAEFGAFIVLCGLTHVINVWTYQEIAANAIRTMTFFKVATAAVSCATAVTLSWVIPDILSVKKREIYLVGKVIAPCHHSRSFQSSYSVVHVNRRKAEQKVHCDIYSHIRFISIIISQNWSIQKKTGL
jgi:hypothetical protein